MMYTAVLRRSVFRSSVNRGLLQLTSSSCYSCKLCYDSIEINTNQLKRVSSSAATVELEEVSTYNRGRKKLAQIMGVEQSEADVEHAVRYLLPTSLSAKDARPFLKHPSQVFPSRTESLFHQRDGLPLDAAFYTGSPAFYQTLCSIYQHLASESDSKNQSTTTAMKVWVKKDTMANVLAEELTDHQYDELIHQLNHLAKWESSPIVKTFLETYRQPPLTSYKQNIGNEQKVTEGLLTVGKRKSSTAIVQVKQLQGVGEVCVNNKPFNEYFPRPEDREQVLYPLIVTRTLDDFNIVATVKGGGTTGQAGAIRLGISKALILYGIHDNVLREKGLLVRDSRSVERKKPGQKKARKKFAWVKR